MVSLGVTTWTKHLHGYIFTLSVNLSVKASNTMHAVLFTVFYCLRLLEVSMSNSEEDMDLL